MIWKGGDVYKRQPLISYAPWDEFVLGSSGKILDIMEARIYKENPEAETGEIQVRGENGMAFSYTHLEVYKRQHLLVTTQRT